MATAAANSREKPTILVIDDSIDAANALRELLRALGWNAESAYSAEQARAHLAKKRTDIIVLDIGMPGIDGYQFARELREVRHLTIPIIALTGYDSDEHRKRAYDTGFSDILVKPIGMQELRTCISALLE